MLFLNKHIIIISQYSKIHNYLDVAVSLAKKNQKRIVQLFINGAASREQINQDSLPKNLTINYYPSNRRMEPHLILLNLIAHNSCETLCYIHNLEETTKIPLFQRMSAWSYITHNNKKVGILINRKRLIKQLKNSVNLISQLRDDVFKLQPTQ